jgi:nucleotide-binding universal stress UspA family protein
MTTPTFVVPLDGSLFAERALPVARTLAERVNGRLLLVSGVEHGTTNPGWYLDEIVAREEWPGIDTVVVKDRYPADAIAHVLAEADDRVVCMTTHGRGGVRRAMLGSTAEEVVRRAGRPTLLVGPHCRDDFLAEGSRLLACVDGTSAAETLAPAASEWAGRLGLGLSAAMVVHPIDVERSGHADEILDPIIDCFGGPDRVAATMLTGTNLTSTLTDYAGGLPAAMLAMAAHARTGLARFALGSMTSGVVHEAPCPVLVVPSVPT